MALIVGGTTVTGTQTLEASTLTGTASAINGSNITSLPAPSAANVGAATAQLSAGDVGGYGTFLTNSSNDAAKTQGQTLSGGSIKWSNCSGHTNGATPSGTWKIVGQGIWNGQAPQRTSVWFRIS